MNAGEDFSLAAARIDDGNWTALGMPLLPLGGRELPKRRGNTRVKRRRCLLDAVVRSAARDARQPFIWRQIEQHGEVGRGTLGGDAVGGDEMVVGNAASRALIRICRQKETIEEHDRL